MQSKKIFKKISFLNFRNIVIAFILALTLSGIIFSLSGYNPIQAYWLILKGAFGSTNSLLTTLNYAAPLILSGLAFAVANKANLMNLGVEGQMYVGAMLTALVAAYAPSSIPRLVLLPLLFLISFIGAGLYGAIAAALKIKFGSNEIIVTIMLNYIAQLFCNYLIAFPLRDGDNVPQTKLILEQAKLARLTPQHQVTSFIIIAVVLVFLIAWMLKKTEYGFQLQVVGQNQLAAETAGINYKKVALSSMFLSAGIAGIAGAGQILGMHFRFIADFSSGVGFEGVAVSALAGSNPLGILISGTLFGGLKAGAMTVNRVAKIPMDYIIIIQALVVIFVASPRLIEQITSSAKSLFLISKERKD